jgi:YVTN family beta-propeller protein
MGRKNRLLWLIVLLMGAAVWSGCEAGADPVRHEAVSTRNVIMNRDGSTLYVANIDVPTVTVVNAKTRKVNKEIPVCKDPATLALSPDESRLAVACKGADRLDVIDVEEGEVVQQVEIRGEPYGVLFSPDGKRLYVSAYRADQVDVVDTDTWQITKQIPVSDGPRAMALTSDGGKLYTVHYLSGKISVIDTRSEQVRKVVALSPSPDKSDRKKSQGVPNTLEAITISPDGKRAWIAHLLTNIDTPIRFDETIFPAVSVLDLTRDEEMADERKELFEEINVKDTKNVTMIVSNPSDIVFHPNGKKAYVLMGGSEDLVVFDLERGGNATSILRRVPGDNPMGLAISRDGARLYVHNAMSLDLAFIDTNAGDPYAGPSVNGSNLRLVKKDSLSPVVRQGKRLFFSANSEENAADITKDNWMSCASCHAGGETNGLTMMTPKGPRNTPSNVLAMETGRFLWDGSRDDFEDYILTVQGEMGGMLKYDPGKPLPPKVKEMYRALAEYLKTIPVPKNPDIPDNVEQTAEWKRGKEIFEGQGHCIQCHAGQNFTDSAQAVDGSGKLTVFTLSHLYDVGTKNSLDRGNPGDPRAGMKNPRPANLFDVPTLRGVFATPPYLHDGSAATIRDVLVTRNGQGKHGNVQGLSEADLRALILYVESLDGRK